MCSFNSLRGRREEFKTQIALYMIYFKASVRPATALVVLEASFLEHSPCLDYARPTSVPCMSGIRYHEALLGDAFNLRLAIAIGKPLTAEHQIKYV